jgi:shikimate dehydrogenase
METNPGRFAVMGNPIIHSLSPLIHTRFAQQIGLELRYDKIEVAKECFELAVSSFFAHGGQGLNITLPFKERAFAMATHCTPRCQQAKAANTLWMSGKKLHAENTDGIGLIRDLSNYQELMGKRILLLGAGGAARGIIGPLLAAQIAQLIVVNRTEERADALQADFAQIKCCSLSELQGRYDLIINATSASLTEERMSIPQSVLETTPFCYDLTYSKEGATSFVQWAHERGLDAIDGLGMLVEQAAEAFFIWHGLRPDTASVLSELRRKVL